RHACEADFLSSVRAFLCLTRCQGRRVFLRQTGFPDCSSSNVTATAAFAERRTLYPSMSATNPRSMKCAWPLCWPSPLSRFASLMRPLATPSTVPTWTPSAPITSMFWAILSVVIWSLLVGSPIALELHVLRQAESRELPTHVRREEIPVVRAEVARRRHFTGAPRILGKRFT